MAEAWPEVVWDAPVLRGLDARARSEIEASGRFRTLGAGEVLYRAGDPADALFVVAAGACTLHGIRRGEVQPALIRRASRGETFGEDATAFAFSTRQLEARSEASTTVAEVPAVVLKRALGRAGGAPLLERIERGLRRAATQDLLRTASFTAGLSPAELDQLLDAARHREIARGEPVYREGDPAKEAFLVIDGLLQAQSDDGGTPRVEAYLARGDVFGDEELDLGARGERRRISVVAAGPSWLVSFPADVFAVVARRAGDRLAGARRLRSEVPALSVPVGGTTAHVFRDLYRMRVARSLLVIDQNACVRCGHCVSSCADAHEDGTSRLIRRGDKVVAQARAEPLMIPNSCQHCKNPSCMIDCPTGAIGRDARGEVFIREALCTGCGSCAKACPWDNIQLAPRKDKAPFAAVAVKCDLCHGKHGGPQCVAACPAEAIARIEPETAFAELGGAAARVMPPRTAAWPWLAGAAIAGLGGVPLATAIGRLGSGVAAGVLFASLGGYAAAKRRLRPRRGARALFIGHLALGLFATGVVAGHVPGASGLGGVAAALTVAFALAVVTGIFGAVAGAVLPRRLTRIERASALPEELAALPKAIDERIFGALSGTSEAVKRAFVDTLAPYQRALLGPVFLIASGRTLREEEATLGARAGVPQAAALVRLVRLVVEHRAVRAQRILTAVLRGWLVPHLAATTAAIVLLVLHVVVALHLAGGGR